MKTGIAVSVAFWTSVAVFGFWGWLTFCAAGAVALWYVTRRVEGRAKIDNLNK